MSTETQHNTFSINTGLATTMAEKQQRELDELNSNIDSICERATVKGFPIARSILQQFDPSPSDLKMLSKVFMRLSEYMTRYKEVNDKAAVLRAISDNPAWIYDSIGAPDRDIDLFLESLDAEVTESDNS